MSEWKDISTAPRDESILVWFDHDADPYHDGDRLTDYACHAANAWEIGKAEGQNAACSSGRNHGERAIALEIRALKSHD